MSNVFEFPAKEKIYDEASAWIAKFDRGLKDEESREFQRWVRQSKAHQEIFFEMARLWDSMDVLSKLSEIFPEKHEPEIKSQKHYLPYTAVAACMFVGMVSLFSLMQFKVFDGLSDYSEQLYATIFERAEYIKTYETEVGESSTIALLDGSTLILNTNSLAQVKYTDKNRLITLERGEIHIDVAHNPERPLSVKAGDKVVQALGTAFNVELNADEKVELIVTDGKVRIGDRKQFEVLLDEVATLDADIVSAKYLPESSLSLVKGEKVVLGQSAPKVEKIDETDLSVSLSWQQGNLVFRGETLVQVLEEIGRYTSVDIRIEDKAIEDVRVAGLFKAGDIQGLVSTLEQNFDIKANRVSEEKIYLTSAVL